MHPRKAKAWGQMIEVARVADDTLRDGLAIARAPPRYEWSNSLFTATVMLPWTGLNAALIDLNIILARGVPDGTWEQAFPDASEF